MRTTIEFDPDVAAELARRRKDGRSLRDDVNGLIRLGLAWEREQPAEAGVRFATPTFDSGPPLLAVDDVEAAVAHTEGEGHH